MKLNHYIALAAMSLCIGGTAYAQSADSTGKKYDGALKHIVSERAAAAANKTGGAISVRSTSAALDSTVATIITTTNGKQLVSRLTSMNVKAKFLTDKYITAEIPFSLLDSVAALPTVVRINASRTHKAKTAISRDSMKVTSIHNGTGLDTPYDGTGVIIGIIDQGFEYTHPAFADADGNLRIKRLWNRYYNGSVTTDAATILAAVNDKIGGTHATHVAGIAGGSKVGNHIYYGMAPGADLYFYPSKFTDEDMLENVADVKAQGEALGKPWVVNMSLGSQIGPHDGSTAYDQTLSSYIGDGGFVTGAMGNERGQRLHITHTFTSDTDTLFTIMTPENGVESMVFDLWGTDAAASSSLKVMPFLYDSEDDKFNYRNSAYWKTYVPTYPVTTTPNNKDNVYGYFHVENFDNSTYGTSGQYEVGLAITAKAGYVLHGWINADEGAWSAPTSKFTAGDDQYCVAEGAASSPKVIAVASYDVARNWRSLDGNPYSFSSMPFTPGKASPFSSYGPQIVENYPKPMISAPGAPIISAYSHTDSDFDYSSEEPFLTDTVQYKGETYYYGMNMGTSMATPATAGVIALWLQAYPTLPHDSLVAAMRYSAVRDANTGTDEWDNSRGYGRLNAYEGLKRVLQMKAANPNTSINSVANTETPISLSAEADKWRILFNSSEDGATISVYGIDGRKVYSRTLGAVGMGEEFTISTSTFARGIYLLNISTLNSRYTRKLIVR